jgi:hypothetical protein
MAGTLHKYYATCRAANGQKLLVKNRAAKMIQDFVAIILASKSLPFEFGADKAL